jgi:hypothetical protein
MSASQTWFGGAATKLRSIRFGAIGRLCWLSVVRGQFVDRHLAQCWIRRDSDRCFQYDVVRYVVLLRFGRRHSPGGPRFPSLWSLWIGGRSASDADGQTH